jgi:hypothetical protein
MLREIASLDLLWSARSPSKLLYGLVTCATRPNKDGV